MDNDGMKRYAGVKFTGKNEKIQTVSVGIDPASEWRRIDKKVKEVKFCGTQIKSVDRGSFQVTINGHVIISSSYKTSGNKNGNTDNGYDFMATGEYDIIGGPAYLEINFNGFIKDQTDNPEKGNYYLQLKQIEELKEKFNEKMKFIEASDKGREGQKLVEGKIPLKIVFNCHGSAGKLFVDEGVPIDASSISSFFPFDSNKFHVTFIDVIACTRGDTGMGLDAYKNDMARNETFSNKNYKTLKEYHDTTVLKTDRDCDAPRRSLLETMRGHFAADKVDGTFGPVPGSGRPTIYSRNFGYRYREFGELKKYLEYTEVEKLFEAWKKSQKKKSQKRRK